MLNSDNIIKVLQEMGNVFGCLVVIREGKSASSIICNTPHETEEMMLLFEIIADYLEYHILTSPVDHPSREWAIGIVSLSESLKERIPDMAAAIREYKINRIKNKDRNG